MQKSKIMNKKYTFYLEITTKCNFNCPFCPSTNNSSDFLMDYQDIIKILDDILPHIELIYFHVLGEPFLHPQFIKILDYLEEKKVFFGITTNGLLLNDFSLILLQYQYLKKINISLQSLIQLDEQNIKKYFENLNEFFYYRQIKNLQIPINLRLWNDKCNDSVKKLNQNIEKQLQEFILYPNVRISYDDEFVWPSESLEENSNYSLCLGGRKQFAILHNGDLVLCCLDYEGRTKIGNLLKNSFEDIIQNEKYQNFISFNGNHQYYFSLCQKCTYRNRFK